LVGAASPAKGGTWTDELQRCILKSLTIDDQVAWTRWQIASQTLNPALADLSAITPQLRSNINERVAVVTIRLLTKDCHDQTRDALMHDRHGLFAAVFGLIGETAASTSMQEADTLQALRDFHKLWFGRPAMTSLLKEAELGP
jgi:hypothetical protein